MLVSITVDVDPDDVLDELDEEYIADYLRGNGYIVSEEQYDTEDLLDTQDWIRLLEIVDSLPNTIDNRRLRDKILIQRMKGK